MSIIRKMRKQKAVWWARLPTPDEYGKYSFLEPVEIPCRWDDVGKEYRNRRGEQVVSQAVVYPDRILAVGDRLKKGELDSNTPDDPLSITNAYSVERFDQTPNLRNTETLFTAYL